MTRSRVTEPVDILLVEDNLGDVRLTQEALREARTPLRLHVVRDGVEALAFLRREEGYRDAPRPGLVLLDLNLPRKDGREVLTELKSDESLASIPVVVLTSSQAESDIERSYRLHANCYVAKPADFEQYLSAMRMIEEFWLKLAKLPGR